ncbi:complex I NDUFA9 subunit family protein [Commensalibacter oyaizuii]|uniref:Complex I NDUFA9 subunit family protein n=1 Tax=Commensalibacter oyaizuii TaxID=3043873 RepID=A0ABT6Q0F6_9PROT|nr:complex I NDUFA9 subunit family protein [Commensalibacter sp. TBRC 16381]MDI2090460.1 complex I NDUFA9 subunit family protein [Commensalibacter sp. TBRC 16381]
MSDIRKVATIIGDNGFVENYIVERLVKAGYVVRVAVPQPALVNNIRPFGNVGQITPLYCSVEQENTIIRAVEGATVVINCAEASFGQNKTKLDRKNVKAAQIIAQLCATAGVETLIHRSALGADMNSSSPYLVSKKQGEEVVLKAFPAATILRPSVVFGPEDQFLNKLSLMAGYFPVFPVYKVNTRLQPVYVGDVADAVMQVIKNQDCRGKVYDLAGPQTFTNRELVNYLLRYLHRNNDASGLSPILIRLMAFGLQFMPGSLMTPELLNMMEYDSVLDGKQNGLTELGIVPISIETMAPVFLYCYRSSEDLTELKALQQYIK